MSNSIAAHSKVFTMEADKSTLSAQYIQALTQFAAQHYQLEDPSSFAQNILGIGKSGDLAIFYNGSNKIIGFSRIYCQPMQVRNKFVSIYSGGTYHDQTIDLSFDAAKFGLTKAMKYKLTNPKHEMVYFANANTPGRYQFLATLSTILYPKEGQKIPNDILDLVAHLKAHNRWLSLSHHPMLIGGQMALRDVQFKKESTNSLISYYLSLNPDYALGNSLLVYLPLNLVNIGHGIKHLLTQSEQKN